MQVPISLATHEGAPAVTALPADAALTISGMTVSYGQKPALFSLDATFPDNALSAIVGPNGAGKSTLLKAALGIVPKLSGEVRVFGEPIKAAMGRIAYVPQRASVDWDFPTSALDVVLMGIYGRLGLLKRMSKADREAGVAALDRVGMADFAKRQIGQLSGGQQQRVFLARALAQDCRLTLLDEPFAGVDAATERAILHVLAGLRQEKRAVIAVHHDLGTVREYFDHVLLVNVRKVAEGPVATTFTPQNLQAAYGGRLGMAQVSELGAA